MEHVHMSDFCLSCTLAKITPLLPHQGPIKDFIHQNTLQVFLDKPFHEAVAVGSALYGARPYMELGYYRRKFKNGEISEECLLDAIEDQFGPLAEAEVSSIRHALHNFTEIIDERTFGFLAKRQGINAEKLREQRMRIASWCKDAQASHVSLRSLLNERLGCQIDHDVNAVFFRLIGSYIDQGVILWPLLEECHDFKSAVLGLAKESVLPLASFVDNHDLASYLEASCEVGVKRILSNIFSSSDLYGDYIKESLLHHPGWSGMINIVAHHPESLAKRRNISMEDVLLVKLALEWQFIKNLAIDFNPIGMEDHSEALVKASEKVLAHELSLAYWLLTGPCEAEKMGDELVQKITLVELQKTWHIALERQYYFDVAMKFSGDYTPKAAVPKTFQAVFCIDDRECSFRRHLEAQNSRIETFGFPGFFGIEFYFKPHKRDLLEKMCPAPVTPKYMVMERAEMSKSKRSDKKLIEFASFISRHGANSMFVGFVSAYTLGHLSAFRLIFSFFQPFKLLTKKRRISEKEKTSLVFERSADQGTHNGLFLGFTRDEMAVRVFTALRNMGLVADFAPVVFLIAHGSSSVNNPHFAAYDCGACSGRPGGINARLFASMANLPEVRELVRQKGITIPDETVFVGSLHDTCNDDVKFFDLEKLSEEKLALVREFSRYIAIARGKNAIERCKRFALVSPNISAGDALKEVRHRSKALFEPRPELGHATNALCIVGRRERSDQRNFDRRAFLQSYDPTRDDSGEVLAAIMTAVIPVCGGINLEYFFSRVDPAVYGCGTKLSHNVCSLIGVGNGLDDDLRTGLPIQMTEIHDPVRLLIIIEQTPEIIRKAVFSNEALAPWVLNDWIKIASLHPHSNHLSFYDFKRKEFSAMNMVRRQAC